MVSIHHSTGEKATLFKIRKSGWIDFFQIRPIHLESFEFPGLIDKTEPVTVMKIMGFFQCKIFEIHMIDNADFLSNGFWRIEGLDILFAAKEQIIGFSPVKRLFRIRHKKEPGFSR